MDKVPMTGAGYAAMEAELKHRQQVERPRIITAISEARALGDLSENAEYHAAKEAQSHNEGRIAELEDKISRAEVIDVSKLGGDTIKFGATVKLIDDDTEEEKSYQIVGEHEADVKSGKVSIGSPIARALIGKESGDVADVQAPGGVKSYEIVDVRWLTPDETMGAIARKEISLRTPTIKNLEIVGAAAAAGGGAVAAVAAVGRREVPTIRPRVLTVDGKPVPVLPGDPRWY